jgi:hypothetical protein
VSLLGKWLEKSAGSIRFWILIAVIVYFAYALYFAIYGLQFGLGFISDHYVFGLVTKDPWWWILLYYGSEGIGGSVSIVLRAFAGAFAVYAAFLYWRKKDIDMPAIEKNAARALLLEAGFFLALIPSVIAAFAYNLTSKYLFYFDHTPGLLLLYGTAIPCLAIVTVVPPCLLKLRSKIKNDEGHGEIVKWSCLSGLAYLFAVFWFNYSMLWACVTVSYPRTYQEYGFNFIFQPINFISFALTVFGLFALASTTALIIFPAIKKQARRVNLTWAGLVSVAFGSYFVFNTLYYFLTGTYSAHPSVWYEVIGPLHNPNLWAIAFVFLGVALIASERRKNKGKDNLSEK